MNTIPITPPAKNKFIGNVVNKSPIVANKSTKAVELVTKFSVGVGVTVNNEKGNIINLLI